MQQIKTLKQNNATAQKYCCKTSLWCGLLLRDHFKRYAVSHNFNEASRWLRRENSGGKNKLKDNSYSRHLLSAQTIVRNVTCKERWLIPWALLYPKYQLAAVWAASQIVPDKQACKKRKFSASINQYLKPDANRRLPLQCKCTSPSQECDCWRKCNSAQTHQRAPLGTCAFNHDVLSTVNPKKYANHY